MGFLSALGGILCGALAAVIGGVILDYAQRLGWIVPMGEQWLLLPIVTGMAGLLGGLVSVSMYARYQRRGGASPATGGKPARAAVVPRGMEHVPGMPMFDVEAIRKGTGRAASSTPTVTRTPEQKQ